MRETVIARHRDNHPVQVRDWVLVQPDGGQRFSGIVTEVRGPMRFADFGYRAIQTYIIRCRDGRERPTHAHAILCARRPFWLRSRRPPGPNAHLKAAA